MHALHIHLLQSVVIIATKNNFFTITDGTNNFVRVFITPASFSCMFINQPEESEKFCEIEYGPTTPECKNLTFDSKLYFTSDSSNIEIPLDSPADSNICFIVIAGNGTKNVTIEGKSSGRTSQILLLYKFKFCPYFRSIYQSLLHI